MELAKIDIAISVDMNGATSASIGPNVKDIVSDALPYIAVVHANIHEAIAFANDNEGLIPAHLLKLVDDGEDDFSKVTIDDLNILSNAFLKYNVALVAITLGSSGAFLHMNDDINDRSVNPLIRIAAALEEILRLVKEDQERMKKLNEEN